MAARGFGILVGRNIDLVVLLVVGIVVLDFATYGVHWLMHRIPLLWRAHRVHHSDPFVDITTSLRQHPFESLLRFAFVMVPALVLGLPMKVVVVYRLLSTPHHEVVRARKSPRDARA